jgi:gas vesicle protein
MEKNTKILIAAGVGLAIGGILGLLFAPNKGKDTRNKIIDTSNKFTESFRGTIKKGTEGINSIKSELKNRLESINDNSGDYI